MLIRLSTIGPLVNAAGDAAHFIMKFFDPGVELVNGKAEVGVIGTKGGRIGAGGAAGIFRYAVGAFEFGCRSQGLIFIFRNAEAYDPLSLFQDGHGFEFLPKLPQ
jgi:hypothetical protein